MPQSHGSSKVTNEGKLTYLGLSSSKRHLVDVEEIHKKKKKNMRDFEGHKNEFNVDFDSLG